MMRIDKWNKIKNKKAQLDFPIITFLILAFVLLMIAPFMLKIFNQMNLQMGNALGNVSSGGDVAKENFQSVFSVAIGWWDYVILFAFIVAVILLIISAFLIDTHPIWVILYIVLCFVLVLFAPNIIQSLEKIYESADPGAGGFATEVNQLPFTSWIYNNFDYVLIGLIVLTGIIIYGKISLSKGGYR